MAWCIDCRTTKTSERGTLRCSGCQAAKDDADERRNSALPPVQEQLDVPSVSPMLCVTTTSIPGHSLREPLGIVTAECALGMNLFRDFFAGMTDIVGGRSEATQNVLRDAREACLKELRVDAAERGANAITGVDLDYNEFSGGGKSMLFLVASGTAVVAEPLPLAHVEVGHSTDHV